MKRQFVFGTVMAAALTVGLGAQSPTPQSTPQTPSPSSYGSSQDRSRPDRGQAITLTGCLQSGDMGGATGTSGAAGTAPKAGAASGSSDKFVLTEVIQSSADKSGAAGTAGATTSPTIPTKLNLMASGSSSANWSRYLNHKVEVKGTLGAESKPSSAATTPTETPTTPPTNPPANPAGAAGTMSSSDTGATFNVTSIKEVSSSCSGSSIK
jgi:hypothetical protein